MDIDSIEVGVDFAEAIQRAVNACQVLLALIGDEWLTISDAEGQRRLDDPDDTVRLEIEAALARNIRVIPVLVDNTLMPRRQQLPDSLVPLARRNALELSYNRYAYDLGRLLEAVEKVVGHTTAPSAASASSESAADTTASAGTASEAHATDEDMVQPAAEVQPGPSSSPAIRETVRALRADVIRHGIQPRGLARGASKPGVRFSSVAFSPDGRWLATACNDETVILWEIGNAIRRATLTDHRDIVSSVAFSPDGRWLATGSADQTAILWEVDDPTATPHHVATLTDHRDSVLSVAFSPDGRWLATGSADQTAIVWDRALNQTLNHAVLTGHQGPVRSVAFSYDSELLATGSDDKSVILWFVTTYISLREFEVGNQRPNPPERQSNLTGHQAPVRSVAFSPDRQLLATASDDKDAMVWAVDDATTPEPVATLTDHIDQVASVTFSPDGRLLATASADGTAILYNLRV
jgi:hypothetical protein